MNKGCFICKYAHWDADGCICDLTGLLVGNAVKGCKHIEIKPIAADVKLVISDDNCIVCGHDVRKDNVYYDVNGGTICESCMKTKCKCKNGR